MHNKPSHEIDYKIILDYMLEHGAHCYLHKIEDKSTRNIAYEAALRLVGACDERNYKRIECSYDLVKNGECNCFNEKQDNQQGHPEYG